MKIGINTCTCSFGYWCLSNKTIHLDSTYVDAFYFLICWLLTGVTLR